MLELNYYIYTYSVTAAATAMNSFLLLLLLLLPHCYYSLATATVVQITFKEMMTAILTLLLGALGIGQSLMDMGDQRLGLQAATRIFQSIEEGKQSVHSIVHTLHYCYL